MRTGHALKIDFLEASVLAVAGLIFAGSLILLARFGVQGGSRRVAEPVAHLLSVDGEAQYKPAGSFVWVRAPEGFAFIDGDTLRTSARSGAWVETESGRHHLGESTIIIFRKASGAKAFDLVFGQFEDNGASQRKDENLAALDLWWVQPAEDEITLAEGESDLVLSWGSNRTASFRVEWTGEDQASHRIEVTEPTARLERVSPGIYDVTVVAVEHPQSPLRRRLHVHPLRAPRWMETRDDQLRWSAGASAASEIRVLQGQQVVWTSTVATDQTRIPSEVRRLAYPGPLSAQVRTRTANGTWSPWSLPWVLSDDSTREIPASLRPGSVILDIDAQGAWTCLHSPRWDAAFKEAVQWDVEIKDERRTWTVPLDPWTGAFCPAAVGEFNVRLLGRSAENRLVVTSPSRTLQALPAPPQLTSAAIHDLGELRFRLSLGKALPLSLEIEDPTHAGSLRRLEHPHEDFTLNEVPRRLRARYRVSRKQVSAWSGSVPVPAGEVPSRALASVPAARSEEELALHARDAGPVLGGDWPRAFWSELRWNLLAEAAAYELQISDSGQFRGEESRKQLRANKFLISFEAKSHLFWRVRAISSAGRRGPWTPVLAVRTQAVNPEDPSVPTRSEPRSNHPPTPERPAALESPTRNDRTLEGDPGLP